MIDMRSNYTDYTIKTATQSDTDEILKLYNSLINAPMCVWTENYPNIDTINFDLQRDSLFIMRNNAGELIGAISIDQDEEVAALECWSDELAPAAELSRLGVSMQYHGMGIAALLMQYGIDQIRNRGYKGVHILVEHNHERALKAYASFNYNVAGECELYGHHYICMERAV